MEQLTKNQAVATSQEAVQNQNEPQLRDENAHNDKSVHGVLNPRSEERFSRNAETDLVCRLLLEKKKTMTLHLESNRIRSRNARAKTLAISRSNCWSSKRNTLTYT